MLIGSPTIELFVNSWNKKYPNDKLYIAQTTNNMRDGYKGYYIGTSSNPTSTKVNMPNTTGYSDTLYFPHTSKWNECYGYWFASPSAKMYYDTMDFYITNGEIGGCHPFFVALSFRPVICLPSSALE